MMPETQPSPPQPVPIPLPDKSFRHDKGSSNDLQSNWAHKLPLWWAVAGILAGMPGVVAAHGDLDEQIEAVALQIMQQPGSAVLYLKRADLHRFHGDPVAAAADYDVAAGLDPALSAVHLGRGQLHVAEGRFAAAREALDLFLSENPHHAQGYLLRARAKALENKHLPAAEDFARAIQLSATPEPEHFLGQAKSLAAAGPEHVTAALVALENGISKLGNVVTLGLQAVEVEVQLGRYDEALARLEKMKKAGVRQEFWLERQGDVLRLAKRHAEAEAFYLAALQALQLQPPRIRNTQSTKLVEERIQQKRHR